MIRFFLRFFGLLLLASAFILVIYDGTKSIAANNLYFTSVRTLWELINAQSLQGLRPLISSYAGGVLWEFRPASLKPCASAPPARGARRRRCWRAACARQRRGPR